MKGLTEDLRLVAKTLRKPAGDEPRFATAEAIQQNHEEFVVACHTTWKKLHGQAIRQIMVFDGFLQREKTHPIGPAAEYFGNYQRALWRKVNDSIVWSLVGLQRHVIKRLCLYRTRGYLSEANPDSVMSFIDSVNADPMKLALWNDATSCVDVGDATVIEDGLLPVPLMVELKEGKVNKTILDLMQDDDGLSAEQLAELERMHGLKARKQYERVRRQKRTSDRALELLNTDRGTDPITGLAMQVFDLQMIPDHYDKELEQVIRAALSSSGEAYELVDDCLWIYANCAEGLGRAGVAARFLEFLNSRLGSKAPTSPTAAHKYDKDRIVPLTLGVRLPMAKPLFVRPLDSTIVAEALIGQAMDCVFLYLDWEKFGGLFQNAGGTFRWSTDKETKRFRAQRRELQPVMIRGKVPLIEDGKGKMSVTDPNLVELFFDGERPRSLAAKLMKALTGIPDASS